MFDTTDSAQLTLYFEIFSQVTNTLEVSKLYIKRSLLLIFNYMQMYSKNIVYIKESFTCAFLSYLYCENKNEWKHYLFLQRI